MVSKTTEDNMKLEEIIEKLFRKSRGEIVIFTTEESDYIKNQTSKIWSIIIGITETKAFPSDTGDVTLVKMYMRDGETGKIAEFEEPPSQDSLVFTGRVFVKRNGKLHLFEEYEEDDFNEDKLFKDFPKITMAMPLIKQMQERKRKGQPVFK
jgi:hypothetical protein